MLQIFRTVKPEMIQIFRFYGSNRNLHNHYETLRLSPSATQKDIRQAFVKLSKEMHPDTSKKSGHTDFVRLNEAYKVLSKEHTRRRYDIEMKNQTPGGRPIRVVYYEPDLRDWHFRQTVRPGGRNDPNFYSAGGKKRVSVVTIALLCIVLSAVGVVVQVVAINNAIVMRKGLAADSSQYAKEFKKVRSATEGVNNEQLIAEFEEKLAASDTGSEIGVQR